MQLTVVPQECGSGFSHRCVDIDGDTSVRFLHDRGSNKLEVSTYGSMFGAEWEWHLWGIECRHSSSIANCQSCSHVLILLKVHFAIFVMFQFRVALYVDALDRQVRLGFKHVAGSIRYYLYF